MNRLLRHDSAAPAQPEHVNITDHPEADFAATILSDGGYAQITCHRADGSTVTYRHAKR